MKSPVEKIKELVNALPERDLKVAKRLINNRDFESLRDLVISVDYLMNKNTDNENSIYYNLNKEEVIDLLDTVTEYCILLNPTEAEEFIEDEYSDIEVNEDFM